jgi:hypothetical protein
VNARGKVEYSFNFYILKPIDLKKGADKVMYEPPNRGGKTWTALGRVTGGGDDPGSITDPWCSRTRSSCRAASAWSGAAGKTSATLDTLNASANFPIARFKPTASNPTGDDHRAVVRVHRGRRRPRRPRVLTYPAATLDKSKATLTAPRPPDRRAAGGSGPRTGTTTPTAPAITLTGNFVANDIYEFSYIAKDPKVLGLVSPRCATGWSPALRAARRRRQREPARQPRAARVHRDLRRSRGASSTTSATSASTRPSAGRRRSTATCSGSPPATAST